MGLTAAKHENYRDYHLEETAASIETDELNLIKETWDLIEKKDQFGKLKCFFILSKEDYSTKSYFRYQTHGQHNIEMKNLWIFASNLETEEEMLNNSQLAYHAAKIIDTINRLIVSFNSPESIESNMHALVRLGTKHFYYGLSRKHFSIFEECFLISLESSLKQIHKYDSKTKNAWKKCLHYVFIQFNLGMVNEESNKAKNNF